MIGDENLAFDALSDRVRRQILSALGEGGELTAGEIAERVNVVGRSTVSSHLRILRTTGAVHERRDGRRRLYSLDTQGPVRDAFLYLQTILDGGANLDTGTAGKANLSDDLQQGAG